MSFKYAAVVLDFYDDQGETLKRMFPSADRLPPVIKEAAVRPREKLANEEFALVAVDGGHLMRKYACHDAGTTAMSVIYFMEHGHKLPEEAQKVAASRLASACVQYDMYPPVSLIKTAGPISWLKSKFRSGLQAAGSELGTGAKAAIKPDLDAMARQAGREAVREGGKELTDAVAKTIRHLVAAGAVGSIGGALTAPRGDEMVGAMRGAGAGLLGGMAGGALARGIKPKFTVPGGALGASLSGMAAGATSRLGEGKPLAQLSIPGLDVSVGTPIYRGDTPLEPQHPNMEVVASVVDITGKQPPVRMKKVAATMTDNDYAVITPDGKRLYPIDTWDRVKTAEIYFSDNGVRMAPETRRQFAVKLAAKAKVIGYPLDESIKEAGTTSPAPAGHVKSALEMRKVACAPGEAREFLDELFEKRSSIQPEVFSEVLRRFDVEHGLDKGWDHLILDPWSSTYSMTKIAEIVWGEGAERVTDLELSNLALEHGGSLQDLYGFEFAQEFSKDPIGIFKSMPTPQKKHISRLAQNMSAIGSTESNESLKKTAEVFWTHHKPSGTSVPFVTHEGKVGVRRSDGKFFAVHPEVVKELTPVFTGGK